MVLMKNIELEGPAIHYITISRPVYPKHHPSFHQPPDSFYSGSQGPAGAYPSCPLVKGGAHRGQVAIYKTISKQFRLHHCTIRNTHELQALTTFASFQQVYKFKSCNVQKKTLKKQINIRPVYQTSGAVMWTNETKVELLFSFCFRVETFRACWDGAQW